MVLYYFCTMLRVENISFAYDKTMVLKNLNFTVKEGEHLAIIGESGSGKSTLLKLIYGEFDLNKGHIFWKENEIQGPKYNLVVGYDFIKSVAQEFDLMPFITVEENIGKYLTNTFPNEKKARIAELLDIVELSNFSKTMVKLLSGGQKQRVALARAIAKQPEIILLDEPFSNIDNFKKQSLRRSLFRYLKEKNIACIVATHDKDDVLGYADTMIVLHNNEIIANNTPEILYHHPKNVLIASFFGEFNELNSYGLVYANQLKMVANSEIKVIIKQSYFKGNYYLIEAKLENKIVFFEHYAALNKGEKTCLAVLK